MSLPDDSFCLVHAQPDGRERALQDLERGGDLTFTRGLTLTEDALERILERAPHDDAGPILNHADFTLAKFTEIVDFKKARFLGPTSFDRSEFQQVVSLAGCSFQGDTSFARARFASNALFADSSFAGRTYLDRSGFEAWSVFDACSFDDQVSLYGAQFTHVSFTGATFRYRAVLGPMLATERVDLSGAAFLAPVEMQLSTRELACVAARFEATAMFRLRWALVVLEISIFKEPSVFASEERPFDRDVLDLDPGPLFDESELQELGRDSRPAVISVRQVDVSRLTLSGVDLSDCLFQGAFNLDRMSVEGARPFAGTPPGLRVVRGWPPIRRWSHRQVLAEERVWRMDRASQRSPRGPHQDTGGSGDAAGAPGSDESDVLEQDGSQRPSVDAPEASGWTFPSRIEELPDDLFFQVMGARVSDPGRIAVLYRSLRKGYEDSKNEPGAADFYYGEMEMRRLDPNTPLGERSLLFLYWLAAGYGLRGSRALVSLLILMLANAAVFALWGFQSPVSFVQAFLYSANSTTALLRPYGGALTTLGEVAEIIERLLGPLLFGLLVLALRGRIKR